LKKGKEASLHRKHLWVFSGAISKMDPNLNDGELVDVFSYSGEFLARGYYSNKGSIAVRVMTFDPSESIDGSYYRRQFESSKIKRSNLPLSETNVMRLIHGEGDGVPSLIVDLYDRHIVIQAHSIAIHHDRQMIAEALDQVFDPETIYYKSESTMNQTVENEWLKGDTAETIVLENGKKFHINWVTGQKTGFFIDQRENRQLLNELKNIGSVLNTFCYSGGFSVCSPLDSIEKIVSVDSSKVAIEMCNKNIALNQLSSFHTSYCQDVFDFLSKLEESFDMVILDPPAFAKHIGARHQAIQAYKRLNIQGMKHVKKHGFMMTYSCSQVVDRDLFEKAVYSAAIESGRKIQILKHLGQASDHPINIFHPEGNYLKGLLLQLD
jgi:23S rRNA (cytosine1962-C5)-methyltransferase